MRLIDADEATKQVIENSTDEDRLKLVLSIANCPTIDAKEVKSGKWERLTIDFKNAQFAVQSTLLFMRIVSIIARTAEREWMVIKNDL